MIELYNDNNIKVYVDSDEYHIEPSGLGTGLRLKDKAGNTIVGLYSQPSQGLTVTVKGKTVTVEGTISATMDVGGVELKGHHLKLKGNLVINVFSNKEEPVTATLYDEVQVLHYTFSGGYNKVDYILHDKSLLKMTGNAGQGHLKAYLYDNSICTLINGEAEVYAYDSSKVTVNSNDRKVIVNAYDNVKVEVGEGADVVINDESKLVRFY